MERWVRAVGAGAVVFVAAAPACSVALDTDVEQCLVDADCDARGGVFAGRACQGRVCVPKAAQDAGPVDPVLGCLGSVTWPAERAGRTVVFRQRFSTLVSPKPVEGAEVFACSVLDPECAAPVDRTVTDAKGDAILRLPEGFRGYLQIPKAPPAFPEILPHLYAVLPPPTEDMDPTKDVPDTDVWQLVTAGELNLLLAQVGASIDPELGHISAQVVDCRALPLAAVTATVTGAGAKTLEYYFSSNDLPSDKETETSASGIFGFINVTPGVVQIETTTRNPTRRHGRSGVFVKKGWVTLLPFFPTP